MRKSGKDFLNSEKGLMTQKLILNAVNIHQGGGAILLNPLLRALASLEIDTIAILDERMAVEPGLNTKNIAIKRVPPKVIQRLRSEWWISNTASREDVLLCFGNLPPLFNVRSRSFVFLQNRYLIDSVPLSGFFLKARTRLLVERLWLSFRTSAVDEFIVQTPSMLRLLQALTKGKVPVSMVPFVANRVDYFRKSQKQPSARGSKVSFVYVASGEPHKNHQNLILAWALLAQEELYPSLHLTLDRQSFSKLCSWIEMQATKHQLNIINEGGMSLESVYELYGKVDAMVYPSTFESFGLPLIEARQQGLPILAAELDYVRDVVDPEISFDPSSPVSIARAIKRFMNSSEDALPLQNAEGIVAHLSKGFK